MNAAGPISRHADGTPKLRAVPHSAWDGYHYGLHVWLQHYSPLIWWASIDGRYTAHGVDEGRIINWQHGVGSRMAALAWLREKLDALDANDA